MEIDINAIISLIVVVILLGFGLGVVFLFVGGGIMGGIGISDSIKDWILQRNGSKKKDNSSSVGS